MTTRVIIQNELASEHDVQVCTAAPGYTGAMICLKPGMSHSEHIWVGLHLEVHEIPRNPKE